MFGPYKCNCCGEVFDEPRVIREYHGFHDGFYETFCICPYCGGDYDDYDPDEEEYDEEAAYDKFITNLQALAEQKYPGLTNWFEEPSTQGGVGGDFISFVFNNKVHVVHFDYETEHEYIHEYGPEAAAKHYFEELQENVKVYDEEVDEE